MLLSNPEERRAADRLELVACFVARYPAHTVIRAMSLRLAKRCREQIQSKLGPEDWPGCDEAFHSIIEEGLTDLHAAAALLSANR